MKFRILLITVWLLTAFFVRYHYNQMASLIFPVGGEVFDSNQEVQIRWTPGLPGMVKIDLVGVGTYSTTIVFDETLLVYPNPNTSGFFSFVPSVYGIAPGSYVVRMYPNDGEIETSAVPFTIRSVAAQTSLPPAFQPTPTPSAISMPTPSPSGAFVPLANYGPVLYVKVLSPNGGEKFMVGSPIKISWAAPGISHYAYFDVEIIKKGRVTPNAVFHTSNSGTLSWNIPKDFETGTDYVARVLCQAVSKSCQSDDSDSPFSIIVPAPQPSAPAKTLSPKVPKIPSPSPVLTPTPVIEEIPSPTTVLSPAFSPTPSPLPTVLSVPTPSPTSFLKIMWWKFLGIFR